MKNDEHEIEPWYPEGTKVKLVRYDPATNTFKEYPEEIVCSRITDNRLVKRGDEG